MNKNCADTPEIEELTGEQSFYFNCHPGVPCFTDCCRQLELELTPFDVLQLKKQLRLTGRQFIGKYTDIVRDEGDVFPRCLLKMRDDEEMTCPFLSSKGCRVYDGRPGACRTYPLGRGSWQDKQANFHSKYVLLREGHCLGFTEDYRQTVHHWLEHQRLTPYNEANDHLMTLLYHPFVKAGFHPSAEQSDLFIKTLYYLEELGETVKEDIGINMSDTALLNYAVNWLKWEFFSQTGCSSRCGTK